jgi:hypothetical protein
MLSVGQSIGLASIVRRQRYIRAFRRARYSSQRKVVKQ